MEEDAWCSEQESEPGGVCQTGSRASAMVGLEEEQLSRSRVLSKEEVVRRRARRVRQLMRLYRLHYWGLLEELRTKYRRFYLRTGKSGWRDDGEEVEEEEGARAASSSAAAAAAVATGDSGMRQPHAPDRPTSSDPVVKCGFQGCKGKPLPLSAFCFSHILLEPKQCLYKPCAYMMRSGQSGGVSCGRPVLCAVVPCFCAVHYQHAHNQATRVMKKGNFSGGGGGVGARGGGPKLHVLIAEYVRVIQNKRRAAAAEAGAALS